MKTTRLCIFHDDHDGWASAWVFRKWVRGQGEVDPEFLPIQYGQAAPPVNGLDVIVLDFSFPKSEVEEMASLASSFKLIDHHKTAKELSDLPYCLIDTGFAACALTWSAFMRYSAKPWFIDYIADADMWAWELRGSRFVNAYIRSFPLDFETFDRLVLVDHLFAESAGRPVHRQLDLMVDEVLRHQYETEIAGEIVPCVEVSSKFLISNAVGKLAEKAPFGAGWFYSPAGREYVVSLRSRGEGGLDVSEIAKGLGGGGHRNAAGYRTKEIPAPITWRSIADGGGD